MTVLRIANRYWNPATNEWEKVEGHDGQMHVVLPAEQVQTDALTNAQLRAEPLNVDTGLVQPTTPSDTQPVAEAPASVIAKATQNATADVIPIATPSSGKAIRLSWYNLSAHPLNSAPVVVGLRFGLSGTDFYKTALSQYGAATAHSFKSGKSYVQGAVNESLYLSQDVAQMVFANIDYEEV